MATCAGSDCHAVRDGVVSVTPLDLDLTHAGLLERLPEWNVDGFDRVVEEEVKRRMTPAEAGQRRERMVADQLAARGIRDKRVLAAMRKVPRERFVDESMRDRAYEDSPLPIGYGQTISQPYMVARMCELAELRGDEAVLEIGAGSGYQTAVLAQLARQVYAVELQARARRAGGAAARGARLRQRRASACSTAPSAGASARRSTPSSSRRAHRRFRRCSSTSSPTAGGW